MYSTQRRWVAVDRFRLRQAVRRAVPSTPRQRRDHQLRSGRERSQQDAGNEEHERPRHVHQRSRVGVRRLRAAATVRLEVLLRPLVNETVLGHHLHPARHTL